MSGLLKMISPRRSLLSAVLVLVNLTGINQDGLSASVKHLEKAKKEISIEEKLGNTLPLDLELRDEVGRRVTLKKYFEKKIPVILTPVYYTCPHLCTYIFNGLTKAVNEETGLVLGKDYRIISVSIDHKNTPEHARLKKEQHITDITRYKDKRYTEMIEDHWSLMVGERSAIKKLYDSVGFRYKKEEDEYAHTATLVFLTPQAKVARYLYGISYQKNDFKLALMDASRGKISSFVDQVFYYCFRYDPAKRVYGLVAWRIVTLGAVITVLLVIGLLSILWIKERSRQSV